MLKTEVFMIPWTDQKWNSLNSNYLKQMIFLIMEFAFKYMEFGNF